ncbi:Aminotransferase, classes I and II superfamily protein [Ketogulonicigenium robustum]|uniref:Aminotransferase n=1 Tax=Ketogulonicigenium robustum TaxID=92947 RepID=A0A1W6NYK7_9RHOB|nr:aminotransferase class I/II-fold pyridoxal phosphate-dependent enzyme [Ketogulonicigenium robustum]ARO14322.1 Aminotransferase, classes I and II superfamily protein [Ketogulonicigenium robustum]
MKLSQRGDVDPFIVMDVMEAARKAEAEGRHIIHMEVGQPSTGAPQAALARLVGELQGDAMGYTVGLGLPELRARIAQHYADVYGVDLDPARVVVTAGASGAFLLAFNALFETGARVGLGYPCYPSYRQILRALDMQPVGIRTGMENRMQPVAADLAGLDLAGLLVASPANPTGTMLDRAAYSNLSDACRSHDISLISDEIYHGIEYGIPAISALNVTDDVYVINSFSKYFSMTGWRVGWMVVPEDQVRQVERLAQNMFICPGHAAQRLALYALDARPELDANLAVYAANRDLLVAGLRAAGLDRFAPPDGAFYIYVDVSAYTDNSLTFAADLLDEAGIAAAPGVDFDPEEGQRWMRFCYARQTADIVEGIARLQAFMAKRAAGVR